MSLAHRFRPLCIMMLLALGSALPFHAAATPAQAPAVVGIVTNEDGNSLAIIDPETNRVLGQPDTGGVLAKPHLAAFDATSRRLYVGNKGGNLAVFDMTDPVAPVMVANLRPGGDGEIHWVVLADGLVWLAHEGDSAVYAYDPAHLDDPVVTLGKDLGFDTPHGLALRPGTDELWATNRPKEAPGFVLRIDARTRQVIGKPLPTTGTAGDRPNNTAFSPDGRRAFVVNTGDTATQVTLIDADAFTVTGQIEQDPATGLAPHALVFDPTIDRLFVANKNSGTLSVIDAAADTVVDAIEIGDEPHGVAIGPNGSIYATAKKANTITVIDPTTLKVIATIADPLLVGPHQILFTRETPAGTPTALHG